MDEPRVFHAPDTVREAGGGLAGELLPPELSGARDLWFGRFTADAGAGVPRHHHTCDTVAYLIRGRARFRYGDDLEHTLEMGPGDFVVMPRGIVHTEETIGDETAEFILARNDGGGESIYLDDAGGVRARGR